MTNMQKIREPNDQFRTKLMGGKVVVTPGIKALPAFAELLEKIRTFSKFTADNDPYREHDLGALEHAGEQTFWKIDCYNCDLTQGSPDPSDPSVTTRVLTIMLGSEY